MKPGLQPRLDALPIAQRELWPQLSPTRTLGFVLYGGTAIALRLGHRVSVDFDFFTERHLDHAKLRRALPFMANTVTLQESPDTLTVATAETPAGQAGVKVSFFGDIGFGRVGNPDPTADGVLQVTSLDDLMATKLKAILQRVEAKDYQVIAAMFRASVDRSRGLVADQSGCGAREETHTPERPRNHTSRTRIASMTVRRYLPVRTPAMFTPGQHFARPTTSDSTISNK